ncbi:MAG: cytochrome c family protein, partial [Gemmatimonadota bacterium]|nr:cytochrome c family protein [Gemmatimonadota bacterium]
REATNLKFDHGDHATSVSETNETARCTTCHRYGEDRGMASVARANGDNCVTCHDNSAGEHLGTGASCNDCHVPLRDVREFDVERILALPEPPTHGAGDFLNTHGPLTVDEESTCAVCHTQESCTRCHANAERIDVIGALGSDIRVARAVLGRSPEYPLPESHESGSWMWGHASVAEIETRACSNCHTQQSCVSCHGEAQLSAIGTLPTAVPGGPAGVVITDVSFDAHPPGFSTAHGTEAATVETRCESCHTTQAFCIDCHQGSNKPEFHGLNYREQHAADAYGFEAECSSCHNQEVFCRGCHTGSGIGSTGKLDVAFHTGRPFWLMGHASAARQRLENCVSCHAETDCMRCHSSIGAWRINPHGPNFDASRIQERNRFTCLRCHRQEPEEDR